MVIEIQSDQPVRRLLQLGDLHLQTRELTDQQPVLDWVLSERIPNVDVVVIGGDLAGMACPHLSRPAERQAVVKFATGCVGEGCTVLVVRGNHDVPADWEFLNAIPGVYWFDRPETVVIRPAPGRKAKAGVMVHVLPYPDRSWLAQQAASGGEATEMMTAALKAILVGFEADAADWDGPRLLSGHFNTRGAMVSTGQPMIGLDVEVPAEFFRGLDVPLVLLNHIHLGQEQDQGGTEVMHVGSPWPTTFGETEAKCVVEVDLETMGTGRIWTPCVPRITGELHWESQAPSGYGWRGMVPQHKGARVRLKLHYDEGDDIDVEAARKLVGDAIDVKIERCPVSRRRERAPEVVAASGPVDRFLAFEKSEGREVDDGLLTMVREMAS